MNPKSSLAARKIAATMNLHYRDAVVNLMAHCMTRQTCQKAFWWQESLNNSRISAASQKKNLPNNSANLHKTKNLSTAKQMNEDFCCLLGSLE